LLLMLTVHLALVDDQSTEVPVSTTITASRDHPVVEVRPGDQEAATQVEEWLQAYATSHDPRLRERIILAYLGLADRLASRFRDSRGTSPEDLRQTARAGLIAAIDRYDPDRGTLFVPYAVACVVGELKRHLRDTSWRLQVPRPRKEQALRLARRPRSCTSAWAAPPPPASWPSSWSWAKRRSWRRWQWCPAAGSCRWTSRLATTPTAASVTWSPSLKLGRSQRTCWPCPAW
jgi:RNA polymerase sigma factor (sigma-70 family)